MTYLLDTDVLSQTQKRRPDHGVAEWLASTRSDELFVSVLTIGEMRRGATSLRDRGDHRQALVLERWLAEVVDTYRDRIVPVTLAVADAWGGQSMRRSPAAVDGLIAATAVVHGMTMVTRNTRHFRLTGVKVLDPFG